MWVKHFCLAVGCGDMGGAVTARVYCSRLVLFDDQHPRLIRQIRDRVSTAGCVQLSLVFLTTEKTMAIAASRLRPSLPPVRNSQ